MSDSFGSLDAHAYVDSSLNAADRTAFEAAMRRDPRLRARADAWDAQNEAIRLAFGATSRPRAPALAKPSNENAATSATARLAELKRARSADAPVHSARGAARWMQALVGVLVFAAAMVSWTSGPRDPRAALTALASTALRASGFTDLRLDFVSDDPHRLSAWLSSRFAHLSPERLTAPGWSLIGARISPGLESAAALVLYEDALGGRAGLLLEPTDALPNLPPLTRRDADATSISGIENGVAFAVVGPSRSGVGALAPTPPPGD